MWNKGPMPEGTWGWGAVVLNSDVTVENYQDGNYNGGFYFADFLGNKVKVYGGEMDDGEVIDRSKIAFYNNSIKLPINI